MNEYITTNNETTMLAIKDIFNFTASLDTLVELGLSETIDVFSYSPVLDDLDQPTGSFWFNYTEALANATTNGALRLETIKGLLIHGQVLKGITGDITSSLPVELQGIHNISHIVTDTPELLGFRTVNLTE